MFTSKPAPLSVESLTTLLEAIEAEIESIDTNTSLMGRPATNAPELRDALNNASAALFRLRAVRGD